MTIKSNDAVLFFRVQVHDGERGFPPYTVAVKNGGTYLESFHPELVHISAHGALPGRGVAGCHLRIGSEALKSVQGKGKEFKDGKLYEWQRKAAFDGQPHQALRLVFPKLFASADVPVASDEQVTRMALHDTGTALELWFGPSAAALRAYLTPFSEVVEAVDVPDREAVALTKVVEDRDFSQIVAAREFRSFDLVPEGVEPGAWSSRIIVAPHGAHCCAFVHQFAGAAGR